MKPRQVASALGMGALALALASCMKLDMALELSNDDTVDGTMIFAFDKSLSDLMGDQYDSMIDSMISESTGDLPEGTTSEPYEDEDFQGAQFTFTDAPLDEFDDSDMSITHENGEWEFTGTMDMTEDAVGGDAAELGGGGLGDMSSMMDGMDVRVAITFPGEVLETNGTVDGTTVTWSPEFGDVAEMHATASESGGGGDGLPVWLWILIGVVVLAALVGGLFFFSRSRNEPRSAAEGDPAESEAFVAEGASVSDVDATPSYSPPPPPSTEPPESDQPAR